MRVTHLHPSRPIGFGAKTLIQDASSDILICHLCRIVIVEGNKPKSCVVHSAKFSYKYKAAYFVQFLDFC